MNIPDMVAVMLAAEQGAKIEMLPRNSLTDKWWSACTPSWNWASYDYRVKKEPRVFYIATCIKDTGTRFVGDTATVSEDVYNQYKNGGNEYWTYTKAIEVTDSE